MKRIILSSLLSCICAGHIFAAASSSERSKKIDSLQQLCISALVKDAMGSRAEPNVEIPEDLLNPTGRYLDITRAEEGVAEMLQGLTIYGNEDRLINGVDEADGQSAAWRIAIAGDRLREQLGQAALRQRALERNMLRLHEAQRANEERRRRQIKFFGAMASGTLLPWIAFVAINKFHGELFESCCGDIVKKAFGFSYDEVMSKVLSVSEQEAQALQLVWDSIHPELVRSASLYRIRNCAALTVSGGLAAAFGMQLRSQEQNPVRKAFFDGIWGAALVIAVSPMAAELWLLAEKYLR